MKTRATDANIPLWAKTHGYKSPETDELLSEFRDIVGEAYLITFYDLKVEKQAWRLNWYTPADDPEEWEQTTWFKYTKSDPVEILKAAIDQAKNGQLYDEITTDIETIPLKEPL